MNLNDSKYLYFLTLLFCTVSVVGIIRHELWLDEAHHWLLARDSSSITDLFNNTRSEGHPLLWNLLLFGITRLTSNPFGMQLLHVVITTSFVFVFLKKAPFNWIFKTLFIFGYFVIFEYNLISRNYGLGILFLFLAASVFKDRNTKFTLLCVYLALASNTHMLFSVVTFALFLTLLVEQLQNKQLFKIQKLVGCLIFILGSILLVIQIQTTESNWLLDPIEKLSTSERLKPGIVSLFKGLIAFPDFTTLHFWNTNLVIDHFRSVSAVLVVLIYLLPIVLFYKNKKTLFFVYTALVGVQIFFYITQRTAIRFHGVNYIIIILALWMEEYYASEDSRFKEIAIRLKLIFFKKSIIYLLLLIHFFSGIYAYSMDYIYPFTSAKQTVDYLKNEGLNSKEIVSVTCDGTIISAYLERKVYFLCSNGYQSFCDWNSDCDQNLSQQKSASMLVNYMENHNSCVYVSFYPLSNDVNSSNWKFITDEVKIRFLKKFDLNIVNNSYYHVFEVVKEKRSF